jgi:hypothetical protein
LKILGGGVDGIDHNRDYIYLWLKPTLSLTLTSASAVWTFQGTDIANIVYVRVGWLRDPSCVQDTTHPDCIPTSVLKALTDSGIVPARDFPEILDRDVLANNSTPDPVRFQSLNSTFPYEPPFGPNDPVPTQSFNQSNSVTSTVTTKVTDDYTVTASLSGSGNFPDIANATLKQANSWTWSNTTSTSASTGRSDTATVTVGGPAYNPNYNGPIRMEVLYDSMYHTFAFVPFEGGSVTTAGVLFDAKVVPLPYHDVYLTSPDGVTYHTVSNAKGRWQFYDVSSGRCSIDAPNDYAHALSNDCRGDHLLLISKPPG